MPDATREFRAIHIRKAVRDFVIKHDPTTALFNELPLCRGIGRADLAAINGSISGYEIKSARDTMLRLPRQIENYSRVFEYCWAVVTQRHLSKVCNAVPSDWGIVIISATDDQPTATEYRPAQRNSNIEPLAVIRLLWKTEAVRMLRKIGRAIPAGTPVLRVWEELRLVPWEVVTLHVREALKARVAPKPAEQLLLCDDSFPIEAIAGERLGGRVQG
jgi:hypothetical protein